jgi:hypothetical protein
MAQRLRQSFFTGLGTPCSSVPDDMACHFCSWICQFSLTHSVFLLDAARTSIHQFSQESNQQDVGAFLNKKVSEVAFHVIHNFRWNSIYVFELSISDNPVNGAVNEVF